jgi:protein SCO1/2
MQRFLQPRVLVALGLISVLLVVFIGYRGWRLAQSPGLDDFGPAPTFTLTDQAGQTVVDDTFRDQVVVVDFVYTGCRESCPLLTARMGALQERLRREGLLGARVQLLSLTVNPTHDTPAVLRAYAEQHEATPDSWRFLTGPEDELMRVIVQGFLQAVVPLPATPGAAAESVADDGEGGEIMHSNRFVLIDRQGHMRAFYDGLALEPDQAVRDIRLLLR